MVWFYPFPFLVVSKQGFFMIVSDLRHFYYLLKLYEAIRSSNTFEKKAKKTRRNKPFGAMALQNDICCILYGAL